MLIRDNQSGFMHPVASEITPENLYLQRRHWLQMAAASGLAATGVGAWAQGKPIDGLAPLAAVKSTVAGAVTMEPLTPYTDARTYNNYYEFGLEKEDPARNAPSLKTHPWAVRVEGLVNKPKTFGLEELL